MTTTHDTQEDVIRNLAKLLETSKTTKSRLARFSGKDPSTITERMNGGAVITVPDLTVFADFFNIHVNVLFFTEDEMDAWLTDTQIRKLRQRVLVDLDENVISIHAKSKRSTRHPKQGPTSVNRKTPCIAETALGLAA